MTPLAEYDESLESLIRISMYSLLVQIGQARDGHLGAQSYDTPRTSGHTTIKFCEIHEQDRCICGQSTSYPAMSDPTGELAVRLAQRHDIARRDLARVHRAKRDIIRAARVLEQLHRAYTPHHYEGSDMAAANQPGCRSCSRLRIHMKDGKALPRWEPIYRDNLCRWCYDWRRDVGGLPKTQQLQKHHDGGKVMRPVKQKKAG